MSKNKITQEYIAKELHLSRNTVSKVLNNLPGVTEKTRDLILRKANELSYQYNIGEDVLKRNVVNAGGQKANPDIAFLCHSESFAGSFWTSIIKGIEQTLSNELVNMRFVIISPDYEESLTFPNSLTSPPPDGIIMAGLFSNDYYKKVAAFNLPLVTMDISTEFSQSNKICDVIMMENQMASYTLTTHLIKKGHTNLSFVGDKDSCLSFYERWLGFYKAMSDNKLPIHSDTLFNTKSPYRHYQTEEFYQRLRNFSELPTAFVCANDVIAKAVSMLKFEPYKLYDNFDICGFDNTAEYISTMPHASTVEIHPDDLGKTLGEQILWRIKHPERQFRTIRLDASPILK